MLLLPLVTFAFLFVYFLSCVLYHRYVRCTGKPVKTYHRVPAAPLLTGDRERSASTGRSAVTDVLAASGVEEIVSYFAIAGDLSTALVAKEVLDDRVSFRHGIRLSSAHGGNSSSGTCGKLKDSDVPLVVDIGAHIGLFSRSVMRANEDAIVVAAEPVPQLFALAVLNTMDGVESLLAADTRVFVELMAVGKEEQEGVELTVNPFITAGSSLCLGDITSPLREKGRYTGFFLLLRAIGLDNAHAGNFPLFLKACARKNGKELKRIYSAHGT